MERSLDSASSSLASWRYETTKSGVPLQTVEYSVWRKAATTEMIMASLCTWDFPKALQRAAFDLVQSTGE
jgi:hypothetical protein